jgi:hypothetical protein
MESSLSPPAKTPSPLQRGPSTAVLLVIGDNSARCPNSHEIMKLGIKSFQVVDVALSQAPDRYLPHPGQSSSPTKLGETTPAATISESDRARRES